MSRESRLQQLLKSPQVWRNKATQQGGQSLKTGFAVLDKRLNGGWPVGALTELLVDTEGAGELSLLMPALTRVDRWIAWVAPPHIPYPPALAQHGIDVHRVLVAKPATPVDALWAVEQALRSDACGAVLGWLANADDRSLRRLQLAAEAGRAWAVIFRHSRFAPAPSPAPLRIAIDSDSSGMKLKLLRNRYGAAGELMLSC